MFSFQTFQIQDFCYFLCLNLIICYFSVFQDNKYITADVFFAEQEQYDQYFWGQGEMNTEVTAFPSAHPWSKNTYVSSLNHSDSSTWIFPSLLTAPNSSHPSCERMYPGETDRSWDPQHPGDLETQLDFFHKLGYSTAQVQAVQQKFGPYVDTDKVLGELVRIGASREAKQGPVTTMSVLVPKGDTQAGGPTMRLPLAASSPQREESEEDEDALRPVVIDGSNVAMR